MKISVIIPVYNAAKHLEQCINSLLNQTFSNCEFIFINDGSTDESAEIITNFQQKDNRIQLISQKNQGVSVARNNGLQQATGDYIGFVDADDYIKNNYLQVLFTAIQKYDAAIVVANFITETAGKFKPENSKFNKDIPYKTEEIYNYLLPEFIKNSSLNPVWNKLYKATIIQNITFPIGVALGEDGIFNMQAFKQSNSILFIEYAGYFYNEIEGSATKNINKNDYFKRALDVYNFKFEDYFDFPKNDIQKWKSFRFIDNVLSLVHIYFSNNNGLSFLNKYKKVSQIISNDITQNCLRMYKNELQIGKSKYQKAILKLIQLKAVFLLFLVVNYSQIRNK